MAIQKPAPLLIDRFIGTLLGHRYAGTTEWVNYTRVEDAHVDNMLAAAQEAGRRVDATIHGDVVPDTYKASVKPLPGHAVLRFGDTPAPWKNAAGGATAGVAVGDGTEY